MLKSGARLESQVCQTQVIVVKSTEALDELCAGGAPMIPVGSAPDGRAALDPARSSGTQMGKRYVAPGGAEVLVTRAGIGSLTIGDAAMTLKEAKPLPASD
ncbi:hypothetical protein ORI20_09915 [Mycobacterium sp. CVI_P3]|uniref:Uncharacterized protein n=1 Tax=Mycobacterium pinniadriaticum TaxID=2994102 RepID=A0ABT3SBY4_9MYCO|nr:hypothetical protein [Mycobacterium pinniadriaticum]MCX2930592.1 hypothetical protein [Mycobacterium pinniadriaticum]MCX2937016.1 hypothetical protein [Mycobacterium pinniadriaticum]